MLCNLRMAIGNFDNDMMNHHFNVDVTDGNIKKHQINHSIILDTETCDLIETSNTE